MSDENKQPKKKKETGLLAGLFSGRGKKKDAPAVTEIELDFDGAGIPDPAASASAPEAESSKKGSKSSGFMGMFRKSGATSKTKTSGKGEPAGGAETKKKGLQLPGLGRKAKLIPSLSDGLMQIPKGPHVDIDVINDGVVQIGRNKVAMALSWRTYNSTRKIKEQAEAAAAAGKTGDYTLYVDTRATGLVAFGGGEGGHRRGMKALITMIDGRYVGRNWLAAFQLGDTNPIFWIASMRGGEVYEDRIIKDKDTAREILLGLIDAPDWTKIVAPEDWEIRGTEAAQITDIIDPKGGLPLKPVRPIRANLPRIILGTVVIFALAFGYARWHGLKVAEIERLAEMRRMERESVRVTPKDYPWFETSKINDFIETCAREIDESTVIITGWQTAPIACTNNRGAGNISTSWKRSGGRISWLLEAIPEGYPAPRLDGTGNQANFNRSFEGPKRIDALTDRNWSAARIQNTLLSRFQNLDIPVQMNEVIQRQANNRRNAQKAVFNHHIIQIRTKFPIHEFGPLLEDIPAVAPDSLIYTPADNSWSLIFRVYHPPILPAEN